MTDISRNLNYAEGLEKPRKRRRKWVIIISIILFLIVLRLVLPFFVLKYVNKTLKKSETYPGHVEDIDLAIIRGAYVIKDIRINKRDSVTGKVDTLPFFTASAVDLSVEWKALFKGKVVGEVIVSDPRVNFVKGRHKGEDEKKDTADFKDVIRDLMPLTINRFEINNGRIHYIDLYAKPALDVSINNLHVVATNLSNVNDSNKVLPAGLKASAEVYDGSLEMNMKFDALQKQPTFDLNTRVTGVNMVKLNDFFKTYGNFDVQKGTFGLYTEFAGKEGKFNGYVKPLIKDLDVVEWSKEEGDLGQKLWESVIGAVGEIFENQPREQLATKVPISGKFDNPDINLWNAISYVLRNAFVHALQPQIDQTIDIGDVEEVDTEKTFLQKVFGKDKKDKKNDDKQGEPKDKKRKDRGPKEAGKDDPSGKAGDSW